MSDMVRFNFGVREYKQTELDIYEKLAEADIEIAENIKGMDFFKAAKEIRDDVFGRV